MMNDKSPEKNLSENPIKRTMISSGVVIVFWFVIYWEYLPEWFPMPGDYLMWFISFFRPCLMVIWGIPLVLLFLRRILSNGKILIQGDDERTKQHSLGLLFLTIFLALTIIPFLVSDKIESVLINYAINRYDNVIQAVEEYQSNNGHYPASLELLKPNYITHVPRSYMKFGTMLRYDPDSESGYAGYGPFTFELFGSYRGVHGQTLKYCPVTDDSCKKLRSTRINDRWVWLHSSAL